MVALQLLVSVAYLFAWLEYCHCSSYGLSHHYLEVDDAFVGVSRVVADDDSDVCHVVGGRHLVAWEVHAGYLYGLWTDRHCLLILVHYPYLAYEQVSLDVAIELLFCQKSYAADESVILDVVVIELCVYGKSDAW